ncbi:Hypothetical predicted protein [Olea europaea subsp. europaea]|uniref:Uncharacterized protein n=1 Tax=Olea europaea subsp. europaea TaxID=158383 RepID=A0A8S0QNP2_OLEEU|nr:Hypothetical predicted protein [Olea europaea subsp. europaea]
MVLHTIIAHDIGTVCIYRCKGARCAVMSIGHTATLEDERYWSPGVVYIERVSGRRERRGSE